MERLLFAAITGIALLGCSNSANAQNGSTKVISEDGVTYSIKTPDKWVSDDAEASSENLSAVFLPASKTWNTAGSKIFSNVEELDVTKDEKMADIISYDKKMYLSSGGKVAIFDEKPIAIENGKRYAHVLKIDNGSDGLQVIAYFDENKAIPTIVMMSVNNKDFQRDYPIFEQVVSSYDSKNRGAVVEVTQ